MERFLLYLDVLEDWFFACAFLVERSRRIAARFGMVGLVVVVQIAAVWLTLQAPVFGAALAALLTVTTLYRSATAPIGAPRSI